MSDLFAARSQMAMSLGFHIIFAAIGIALPFMMVIAEALWLRTKEEVYLLIAQRWAKGAAILFAVGAVSGTVLSFELGLLWPGFMQFAGAIIGFPFTMEGFAFFTEAIFLGIYLYGWKRVPPAAHLFSGVVVALSGAASGLFVVAVNGWMNAPAGFRLENGKPVDIDPVAAMFNEAWLPEAIHMTIAAYLATAAAVAGVHAFLLLKDRSNLFHRRAFTIAFVLMTVTALLQPLSGDINAQYLAHKQPRKLAAMEGQFETEKGAPLRIGGLPDVRTETTRFAIDIPYGLSLLAFHDPNATVKGLKEWPREEWPPVAVVHIAFQVMVGAGSFMALVGLWGGFLFLREKKKAGRWEVPDNRWLLRAILLAAPLGFVAIEAGWIVTEVGRQPWIIVGIMRTRDAVTPVPNLIVPFVTFTALYLFLAVIVVYLLLRQVRQSPYLDANPAMDSRGQEKFGAGGDANAS